MQSRLKRWSRTPCLLATIGLDGRPTFPVVLLKDASSQGLVFFTHYTSPKGEELAANPVASARSGGLC